MLGISLTHSFSEKIPIVHRVIERIYTLNEIIKHFISNQSNNKIDLFKIDLRGKMCYNIKSQIEEAKQSGGNQGVMLVCSFPSKLCSKLCSGARCVPPHQPTTSQSSRRQQSRRHNKLVMCDMHGLVASSEAVCPGLERLHHQ